MFRIFCNFELFASESQGNLEDMFLTTTEL